MQWALGYAAAESCWFYLLLSENTHKIVLAKPVIGKLVEKMVSLFCLYMLGSQNALKVCEKPLDNKGI